MDANFPDHPKVVNAGHEASWMYVCGVMWCARLLTDGHIPAGQVQRLTNTRHPDKLAKRLVEVGLWELAEGGFCVHDYGDWQSEAGAVEGKRLAENARKRRTYSGKSPPGESPEKSNSPPGESAETFTEENRREEKRSPLPPIALSGMGGGVSQEPTAAEQAAAREFNLARLREVKVGRVT